MAKRLNVRFAGIETLIQSLSGGNQQKIILARQLMIPSKLLILDEPTRGIDVGAKLEIYNIMTSLVKEGLRYPDDILRTSGTPWHVRQALRYEPGQDGGCLKPRRVLAGPHYADGGQQSGKIAGVWEAASVEKRNINWRSYSLILILIGFRMKGEK